MNFADHNDLDYQYALYQLQNNLNNDQGGRSEANVHLHAQWIDKVLLKGKPSTILDLGCGIGLYSIALSYLGHSVTGVDISEFAIRRAEELNQVNLNCKFIAADFLNIELSSKFDLIIFTYSVFNTFSIEIRDIFLEKIQDYLNEKGIFYLEALHCCNFPAQVQSTVEPPLFFKYLYPDVKIISSDSIWDDGEKTLQVKYFSAAENEKIYNDNLTLYYYNHKDYDQILKNKKFKNVKVIKNVPGTSDNDGLSYESIVAYN